MKIPEFEGVVQQPPIYRSSIDYNPVSVLDRYTVLLKDGETTATIYPIHSPQDLPPGLLAFLCDEFNMEIERGDTLTFFDTLDIEHFQNYWFGSFAAVMVLGDSPTLEGARQWEKECLGTFFIKPNYPGRCSHICTAQFLVNAGIRGKGIGRTLTDCFLQWAPRLGYSYTMFNLVFETNVAARKLWESLNFKRIGRIKAAGVLKGHEQPVDAVIYGRDLVNTADPEVGAYRFDKIKFYLETGRYPAMADRQEKSRLRSSASHYNLENGKLMLKGREVVGDPVRQLQICTEVHLQNHGGINKTTAIVAEKYHWIRIKDTVATAVKNCPECRDPSREYTNAHKRASAVLAAAALSSSAAASATAFASSSSQGSSTTATSNPKKMINRLNTNRHRITKPQYQTQSPRNVIKSDEVEAMVVAAATQLHNNRHHHVAASDLLSHELAGLDDNLIAVVEEAQRNQQQQQRLQKERERQQHHQPQTYAEVAAQAVANDTGHFEEYGYHHHHYSSGNNEGENGNKRGDHDDIPVDPRVESYNHQHESGDAIEIARALIQTENGENDDNGGKMKPETGRQGQPADDAANLFLHQENDS
ncbi:SPT10 [[Candida] subhashii]|uniref:SPT10 n=1 Tax=[Candida] subhashii TaxID=561895 RepID=A0A8J5UIL9_9ASCO|nr:SPT10 [[Candida] subhashii]KAG7663753.1 SPT10 [[Candida] subhashii]